MSTQTTTNPVQAAQQPYLNYGWGEAKNLYQNMPQYPGSTVATYYAANPLQAQGYQNLASTGQALDQNLRPQANQVFGQATGGQYGGQYNPAYGGYAALADSTSPITQNYQALQQAAQQGGSQYANAVGQYADPTAQYARQAGANSNLGLSQLGQTASGAYLDPNTNPYMAQMVQAAMDPVTRNYQTSIAPSLDAAASAAGRYGSGTQAGLASTAQQNLGRSLSDLSGNLYGQQFARERQAQDAAAQNYGQLYNAGLNQAMQGLGQAANIQGAAGNQFFAGQNAAQTAAGAYGGAQQAGLSGLSSGFNTGNQAALNAMQFYPQLGQAQFQGAQAQVQGGQGLSALDQQYRQYEQAKINEDIARYNYPQTALDQYLKRIGEPAGGSQSQQTPYYSNPIAGVGSLLSGIGGIASMFMGSDRRLKEDDKVVGKIGDLPIHTFKYKGDDQTRLGFMADEVDPAAVKEHPSGYKMVNYNHALNSALNSFMSKK